MKNIVPCKLCTKDFEYVPGFAGNARQLCDACRLISDNEEIRRLEEETIIESNPYLRKKERFDYVDILMNGNIPKFESDLDRFLCARDVGLFVKQNGMTGFEDNIIKLFDEFDKAHVVIFFNQQSLSAKERMAKNEKLNRYIRRKMNYIINPPAGREPVLYRNCSGWVCEPPSKENIW